MKVANLLSPRSGKTVANQFHIVDGERDIFQSYDSTVCVIDRQLLKITLYPVWDYSQTTRKYLYQFLNQLSCQITSKKELLEVIKAGKIDVFTLELVE